MRLSKHTCDELMKRLRRIEGQLGGIVRMIEDGRDCEDVAMQLAAASKALDRAGFKLVSAGMQQCMSAAASGEVAPIDERTMERLFLALA